MIFLGIDPGKSGGISVHGREVKAFGFSNKTNKDIYQIIKDCSEDMLCFAAIEKVHSMPKQGVVSSFTFGTNYGFLLGCLTALKIPFEYITPAKWQGYLKCRTGGNKNITKQKAQELFPHLKITHATADALLIGEYLKRTYYNSLDLEL